MRSDTKGDHNNQAAPGSLCQTVTQNRHYIQVLFAFLNRHTACQLLAVGEVATVAAGEIARKGITAGMRRITCKDPRTRSNVVLFLEAAVPDVDLHGGVTGNIATWELDALGVWKRATAIAGYVKIRAHWVELMTHQNKMSEWKL